MFRAMTGLFRAALGHVMEKSTSWSTDQCTHSQSLGLVAKQWRQILVIQFTWIGLSFVILRKTLLAYGEPRACRSGVSLMAYGDMHCFFVFRLHIKCRSAKSHWAVHMAVQELHLTFTRCISLDKKRPFGVCLNFRQRWPYIEISCQYCIWQERLLAWAIQ